MITAKCDACGKYVGNVPLMQGAIIPDEPSAAPIQLMVGFNGYYVSRERTFHLRCDPILGHQVACSDACKAKLGEGENHQQN